MQQSLKSKTINGIAWSAFDKFAVQGIQFVIGIILARLLIPSDYGLIGMLTIFISISQIFIDSGFSKALIQKKDRKDEDYYTVFYFNLVVSLLLYLILFISAPYIASFYNEPDLLLVTRILALVLILNAFSVVQIAKYTIDLDFGTMAKINLLSIVLSGLLGIFLAYSGFGVWALVTQTLVKSLLAALIYLILDKWKIKFIFSLTSFRELFNFGSKLLGAGLIGTFFQNIYAISIGKIFNATDLGYYTRGNQFADFTAGSITSIIQNVSFPLLSSLREDRAKFISTYSKLLRYTGFLTFPIMTLFAILAKPFIIILLTEKWISVVPLLQWMCFARIFTPVSALNMSVLNAIGRSDLYLKLDILKVPIMLFMLIITIPFGIEAIVIGHFITSFVSYFINAYFPGKFFNFGAFRQIKDSFKIVLATLFMAVSVIILSNLLSSDIWKLVLGGITGLCIYVLSSFILRLEEIITLRDLFYSKIIRRFN